jgi:hypothetical protein
MIDAAYFSFWSRGERVLRADSVPYEIMAALSVALCRRHFKSVHLITDDAGRAKLEHLPFDSINTDLNELDSSISNVWCLGKLHAYLIACRAGKPFLHVDGDVFLWPQFDRGILTADVCAQNPECGDDQHYNIEHFLAHCPSPHLLRDCLPALHNDQNEWPLGAPNMGIFGGNDVAFIEAYSKAAIAFATDPDNASLFTGSVLEPWQSACIVEQYYLGAFAHHHGRRITYLFPDGWPSEKHCETAGYTHLMDKKRDLAIAPRVQKALSHVKPLQPVLKVYGLPRTGTNVTELLLALNFECLVATQDESSHPNIHYLGWKHGLPPALTEWEPIEQFMSQKVYCVFTHRPYESWVEAVTTRHSPSHEFPRAITRGVLFATPIKNEYYPSYRDLYMRYQQAYEAFARQHPERAIVVNFDDLLSNQQQVVTLVAERFGLDHRDPVVNITKKVSSAGKLQQ